MIYDTLDNLKYYNLSPAIEAVLNYAKNVTSENFPSEKITLDGERIFINAAQYDTHTLADALVEAHRDYIDVMVMIEGEETIYVKSTDRLTQISQEYDPKIEALLAKPDDDMSAIRMKPGSVCILFPQDAHAPGCHADSCAHVKKLIGKVKID